LANQEPARIDYQQALAQALGRFGRVYRALGELQHADQAFEAEVAVRERLAAGSRPPKLRELLSREEGQHLEFKASAFRPIQPSRRSGKPATGYEPLMAVVKAVAGMLNADGGGLIIIGAVDL